MEEIEVKVLEVKSDAVISRLTARGARLARDVTLHALYFDTPARELYGNPRHPYTLGLLRSVPRLDEPKKAKLAPIPGQPPDLTRLPPGCAFAPRCAFALEKCWQENPPLMEVAPKHEIACWVDVKTRALR